MRLTETRVSLTRGRFISRLRKNKYKPLVIIAAAFVCLIAFGFGTRVVTDSGDTLAPDGGDYDYAMRLQHYSGFDMSNPHIRIELNSVYDEVYLDNNEAELQYTAEVYPINLTDTQITWHTGNDVVASVDENGLVRSSVPGSTDISAELAWNNKTVAASARLNVIQPVEGIYMPVTTVTVYKGGSGQLLPASVSPANASNPHITWESKNEKVASVDDTGYVTPVDLGMTEIIATSEDGGFTGKCFVNVVNYSVKVDNVEIQNSGKDDSYLRVGESFTILAAVSPSNAKDKTLTWASEDSSVASVSQTGVVRALKEGETFISVASSNGKRDTLRLTVQPGDNIDALDLSGSTNAALANIVNGSVTYSTYEKTLDEMVDIQMSLNPPPKYDGATKYASREQTLRWMDPSSFCTGAYKYQFLDLSMPNGTTEEKLNGFLRDKGVLAGHAADFIAAANEYGVSEIYLVAHACLETGNGTSRLAKGVDVNGTTVYNVYGIGAYDGSAVYSGSQKAYKEGWTDIGKAIRGGAGWINTYYINSSDGRQNTLYKMLWNPENPGQHQYATDIEWATSQAVNIEKIFNMFPDAVKTYDVPVYSGENPVAIDTD